MEREPPAPPPPLDDAVTISGRVCSPSGPFTLGVLLVDNSTTLVMSGAWPEADSDWDGLVDLEEMLAGTDPTLRDTDGDGLTDTVEMWSSFNPLVFDAMCDVAGAEDVEADGLTGCDEAFLASGPLSPDTDTDYIPDGLDAFMLLDPLVSDGISDYDLDGASNFEEVQFDTNPWSFENRTERFPRYILEMEPPKPSGQACYTFSVSDLILRTTLDNGIVPGEAGWNRFMVYVTFQTVALGERIPYMACAYVRYDEVAEIKVPADGNVVLEEGDFLPAGAFAVLDPCVYP